MFNFINFIIYNLRKQNNFIKYKIRICKSKINESINLKLCPIIHEHWSMRSRILKTVQVQNKMKAMQN